MPLQSFGSAQVRVRKFPKYVQTMLGLGYKVICNFDNVHIACLVLVYIKAHQIVHAVLAHGCAEVGLYSPQSTK